MSLGAALQAHCSFERAAAGSAGVSWLIVRASLSTWLSHRGPSIWADIILDVSVRSFQMRLRSKWMVIAENIFFT